MSPEVIIQLIETLGPAFIQLVEQIIQNLNPQHPATGDMRAMVDAFKAGDASTAMQCFMNARSKVQQKP